MQGISYDASELQGSSAQIKYAQDIIDRGYSYADNTIKNTLDSVEAMIRRFGNDFSKYDIYGIEMLAEDAAKIRSMIEGKKALQRSLEKATMASGIIRNKRQVENVFPDARSNAKDKYYKEYLEKYKRMFKK